MGMNLKEQTTTISEISDGTQSAIAEMNKLSLEDRMFAITLVVNEIMHEVRSNTLVNEVHDKEEDLVQKMMMMKGNKDVDMLTDLMQLSEDWREDIKQLNDIYDFKKEITEEGMLEGHDVPDEVLKITVLYNKLVKFHKDKLLISLIKERLNGFEGYWLIEEEGTGYRMIITDRKQIVDALDSSLEALGMVKKRAN